MSTRPDRKVLERVQKLFNKAQSAKEIGSEAEAEIFMDAVQKMLTKYKLDMSDVEYELSQTLDPVKMHVFAPEDFGLKGKKRRVAWQAALANVVARAHFCETIQARGTNMIVLVGKRQDRQIAELVLVYLIRLAEELSEKSYVEFFVKCQRRGKPELARGYKADWLTGFVGRIAVRYKEEREQLLNDLRNQHNDKALIRLSSETALVKAFMDQLSEAGLTEETDPLKHKKLSNEQGVLDGIRAGDEARIRMTGLAGERQTGQLTEGQRLLTSG